MAHIFWNPFVRIAAFWIVVSLTVWLASIVFPTFSASEISNGLSEAHTDLVALSKPEFVYALASGIFVFAAALAVAFALLHTLSIGVSLFLVQRCLAAPRDMVAFAEAYGSIHRKLERHPLIGHAWKEFDETLVMPDDLGQPIRNTVRPQSFINIGVLRERLFGLKMMGSIPGYFVGIGLLLTFIGLVLALHKASDAVSSSSASGMQDATRELLRVASFKFSTSIAGLGASIALSLLFRVYMILIEGSLDKVCHVTERKLRYTAPQSITAQMNDRLGEQVAELKQINSADFFSRMGEQLSPQIQAAFSSAMAPMNSSITAAVAQLSSTSQSGVSDLIKEFTSSMQGSAGTEMRELGNTLEGVRAALVDAQRNINGSGEDFGRRMSDAAENLNRLVIDAGDHLGQSSEQSRLALADVVSALRETFDHADRKVQEALSQATGTASSRIEEMLGSTFGRLEAQVSAFQSGLVSFQSGMGGHLNETSQRIAESRTAAVEAIGAASVGAARALQDGLAGAMQQINSEIAQLTAAMRETASTLTIQNSALRDTTEQSRTISDAFSRTAQDVRVAATPLVQSGERIAGATERLSETFRSSVTALESGQASSRELAESLGAHATQMSTVWATYSNRFEKVDGDLSKAFDQIHDATVRQGEILADYAHKVDEGLAKAVQKLHPLLGDLNDQVEDLAKSVRAARELEPV